MSLFNDKLKKVTLRELLILIIILFLFQYLLDVLNIFHVPVFCFYLFIIFYFIFKLKGNFRLAWVDFISVFKLGIFKDIIVVVILNIFFSYGMLYFTEYIFNVSSSVGLFNSFLTSSLIVSVVISPVSEELIFRGVFLNRLQLVVPVVFAVLISSLLFASLHSFGGIFSAFVFGVCASLLYLKTGNIFVAIFVHFLNNLVAELIVFLDSDNILFANDFVVLIVSVLAVVSFVVLLIFMICEFKRLNNDVI